MSLEYAGRTHKSYELYRKLYILIISQFSQIQIVVLTLALLSFPRTIYHLKLWYLHFNLNINLNMKSLL